MTAKKPLTQAVLDRLIEPAWWLVQWSLNWLVDALARVHPHRVAAGLCDAIDGHGEGLRA